MKKILVFGCLMFLLASCISLQADGGTVPPTVEAFVTSTLPPTRQGFVPATLTPLPATEALTPSAPTLSVTAAANCADGAVLLRDVTVPDGTKVDAGAAFTKTWEFQNTGDCPWSGYTIRFDSGDEMGAPVSVSVPDTAPKKNVQVSVDLTAPTADGSYTGFFTLNNSAGKALAIGSERTFWVQVRVGDVPVVTPVSGTPYVPPGGNSNCAYSPNNGYVTQVIALINDARAKAKLPALSVNAQLSAAAQGHSADMACNNFLGHTGSDGSWIGDRLARAGYVTYHYVEIIAIGSPQDAMSQWRSLPDHWDAILDATKTEIGAGYAYYANSNFGGYITVDMAAP